MKREGISQSQRMILFWCGVLAPAAEMLPLIRWGKESWLAPVAAIPLVLLAGKVMNDLSGERGLAAEAVELLGAGLGRLYLIIYMVWGQLLLTLRLRLCGERLAASGARDGSLPFFLVGLAAAVFWLHRKELTVFARAARLVFGALLITGVGVLLLALPQAAPERILPLGFGDTSEILGGGLWTAGVLGWGLFAAFLPGRGSKGNGGWIWGGCLALAGAQMVILGNLGVGLAGRLDAPFFVLAKNVGIRGGFQRVESVVASVWLLADLTLMGLILFGQRNIIKVVWRREKWRRKEGLFLLGALLPVLGLFRGGGAADRWGGDPVIIGNLVLGIALPCLLWFVKKARKPQG